MTIAIFGTYKEWEVDVLKQALPGHELTFIKENVQHADLARAANAEVVSLFVDSKIEEAEFAQLPKLKLTATRSTGYDHIDLAAAKARGITVAYVPTYGENTVAEYAFALLLCLSRKV